MELQASCNLIEDQHRGSFLPSFHGRKHRSAYTGVPGEFFERKAAPHPLVPDAPPKVNQLKSA